MAVHTRVSVGGSMTISNDSPGLVVTGDELSAVDQSPKTMAAIPGSRMFEIREALSVYRERHPGATDFDASQGDVF